MKRVFDFLLALIGLIFLFPFMLLIALFIIIDSNGGVLFRQLRVGKDAKEFQLIKFRSMRIINDDNLEITIGADKRITRVGSIIRKFKLDELPQLWNILIGEMSFVGPRPEVPRYVKLYSEEQREVLSVRPGLTDPASLAFINESELLAESQDPVEKYIKEIMPQKLEMNLAYIRKRNFLSDLRLVLKTIQKILS
ncbi:MAG: sugar transferase [Bacteroidota bacterium]